MSIEDGDDSVMTITLSDDHHYEVCWMWNELLIMVTIVTIV